MFLAEGGRPNDRRGFVHKKLLGLGKKALGVGIGFIPGASTARDIISTGRSLFGRPRARATVPRTLTARPSLAGEQGKQLGRDLKFGGAEFSPPQLTVSTVRPTLDRFAQRKVLGVTGPRGGGCPEPLILSPAGNCIAPTSPRGAELFMGEATMGRYGAAEIPGSQLIDRAVCRAGTTLGDDGLCYGKGTISNKQRMWPRGRRPLLTGGDMRAISIAARAGSKLDRTTKRLRELGMMKALPKPRGKPPPHAHAKPVAAVSV